MLKFEKYRIDKYLLIAMIFFSIISILTIYSAQSLLNHTMQDLAFKQLLWYVIGFLLAFFILRIGTSFL